MCGIVAYNLKNTNVIPLAVQSLYSLEYRGYDSVGISYVVDGEIITQKVAGRVGDLEKILSSSVASCVSIAHTRWATHGKSTKENAHPHHVGEISLVHNGIIENYREIKEELQQLGCVFASTTDTETIAHFVNLHINDITPEEIIIKVLEKFKGKYAVSFIVKGDDAVYAFRSSGSPMIVGVHPDGHILASDINTLAHRTQKFMIVGDGEFLKMTPQTVTFFDKNANKIHKEITVKDIKIASLTKGDFPTFMMKEIHEQPQVIRNILLKYTDGEQINLPIPSLSSFNAIVIIACGTSYLSGLFAKYLIEEHASVPVSVEISSEFSHRRQCFSKNTLYIFASQSGETADTISAMEYTIANKTACSKILSLLNNSQSTMAQKSDFILECLAGVEIGVASTKNFIAQITLFYLLALHGKKISSAILDELRLLPQAIESILYNNILVASVMDVAKSVIKAHKVVFTGRTFLLPIACEGALKLSELSYIPVQAIAAGEFKHGPIAIVDETTLVISLTHLHNMYQKTLSSNEEILSRSGVVVTISDSNTSTICVEEAAVFVHTYPVLLTVIVQLLSYYTAEMLGNDIDKPRNLAKSVTVE